MQKVEKIMKTINFTDFSSNPEKYLDRVENNNEILFLKERNREGIGLDFE
jgi:PHD/YefM family antitoxin component YafN of YafNO toxin-antitoxin module